MIRSHTFRGQRWKVRDNLRLPLDALGMCIRDTRTVKVPVKGDTVEELEWIIHESIHACVWDLDEDAVEATAHDIARLLWRLGWRRD